MEIGSADDILDTSEYPDNNRKIVIFDDLINGISEGCGQQQLPLTDRFKSWASSNRVLHIFL